jgi:hypothetical protein
MANKMEGISSEMPMPSVAKSSIMVPIINPTPAAIR